MATLDRTSDDQKDSWSPHLAWFGSALISEPPTVEQAANHFICSVAVAAGLIY